MQAPYNVYMHINLDAPPHSLPHGKPIDPYREYGDTQVGVDCHIKHAINTFSHVVTAGSAVLSLQCNSNIQGVPALRSSYWAHVVLNLTCRLDDSGSKFQLLLLPEDCLLRVLQCCADSHGPCSLFSAARAHSRLHQAAASVLSCINVDISDQQQLDSVCLYLSAHGQHIRSIEVKGSNEALLSLHQLPLSLQLDQLSLYGPSLQLQLQPDNAQLGVPQAGVPLRRLVLVGCRLVDGNEGLEAILSQLTNLEHLSLRNVDDAYGEAVLFPSHVLQHLLKLTLLQFDSISTLLTDSAALQDLHLLTRLQDLQLDVGCAPGVHVSAGLLAPLRNLTRLHLSGFWEPARFEPGCLAGKTKLQNLTLCKFEPAGAAAGVAALLSEVQQMQQLTCLTLSGCLYCCAPSAAAYSALTASSRLQRVHSVNNVLPPDVWGQLFPAGRQLPYLQFLSANEIDACITPADAARLVKCCPAVQHLVFKVEVCHGAGVLKQLRSLTGLQQLGVDGLDDAGAQQAAQLTGLQNLALLGSCMTSAGLLELTQLRCLRNLMFCVSRQGSLCYVGMHAGEVSTMLELSFGTSVVLEFIQTNGVGS